jgi:hypothetical protein
MSTEPTLSSIAAALDTVLANQAAMFAAQVPLPDVSETLKSVDSDGGGHLKRIDDLRKLRDAKINARLPSRIMAFDIYCSDPIGYNNINRSCNNANFMEGLMDADRNTSWFQAFAYNGNNRGDALLDCMALAGPNGSVPGVPMQQAYEIYKTYEAKVIEELKQEGETDFSPPLVPAP